MIDIILFAAVVALQIGDGVSTVLCLRHPSLAEGNPAANRLMKRFGVIATAIVLKIAAVILALAVLIGPAFAGIRTAILAVAVCMFAWAAIGNLRLLAKVRRSKGGAA